MAGWSDLPALRRYRQGWAAQGRKRQKRQGSAGLWKCYSKECRKQFTVKVGTVFECAHIPLNVNAPGRPPLCSSKKGFRRTSSAGFWRWTTSPHGFWLTEFAKRW